MCLVALKVVATMRPVSLKGFPSLHKLAAFKNHLNAMASQNRFRWSHLVQIGTWSAVTKSKFSCKKKSLELRSKLSYNRRTDKDERHQHVELNPW